MQHGAAVEELTRENLQSRAATQAYTRALLVASEGYVPRASSGPQ